MGKNFLPIYMAFTVINITWSNDKTTYLFIFLSIANSADVRKP